MGDRKNNEFAKELGVPANTLSQYINGNRKVPLDFAVLICEKCKVDPWWFMTGEECKPIVSEPTIDYQPTEKPSKELQHIIDEWPGLCDAQKSAVLGVLDAFSKQDVVSLKVNGNSE
jgi:transcriptional regulator with XRE-family HTH domain